MGNIKKYQIIYADPAWLYKCGKNHLAKKSMINGKTDKIVVTENEGLRYPTRILNFANEPKPIHPTQKPVALLEYLIKTYTNEGETVLDNTFGSCSTGVVAVNTNRKFIGIEKDEAYFKIAEQRINARNKKN